MKCKLCNGLFCEDHGSLDSHSCRYRQHLDAKIISCPICNLLVKIESGKNQDRILAEHIESGCTKYVIRKEKKERCALKTCHKKLKQHLRIRCKTCRAYFCVEHRSNHACGDSSMLRTVDAMRKAQHKSSRAGKRVFHSAYAELPRQKQNKVKKMMDTVHCTSDKAIKLLERGRWNVSRAIGLYFEKL